MHDDARFVDLDELEELNPADRTFRLAGRDLILREIPHQEFYAAAAVAGSIQDRAFAGEYAVGALEQANKHMLMLFYRGANPWLDELDQRAFEAADQAWREQVGVPKNVADENVDAWVAKQRELPGAPGLRPKREDFDGTFFDLSTPRKLAYLATEAIKLGTALFDVDGEGNDAPEALRNVPPELAAAMAAARKRGRLPDDPAPARRSGRPSTRR